MKKFDVIVIGSGSALSVASFASNRGMSVALVDDGPLGGTCLNRGCIPSKMLIQSANVAEIIKDSEKFGIKANITEVEFESIVKRVNKTIDTESDEITNSVKADPQITLYESRGEFIGMKELQVDGEVITADKIFIAAGARPSIPTIKGLESTPYLDSTSALRLEKQPKHLVIIGGGYISTELAHFFGALGTKVTMLIRSELMMSNEDEEIARWFTKEASQKYNVLFNTEAEEVSYKDKMFSIKLNSGEYLEADQLLVATGRQPNSDTLQVNKSGIETDEKGNIKANDFLETSVEGVWAWGDIIGKLPFRHTANEEVGISIRNAFSDKKVKMDYFAIGHAAFSSTQVAAVGKTEQELIKEGTEYKVGRSELKDTAMGDALQQNGLVKVLTDTSHKILGVHIVGPEASVLIHEAIIAMKTDGSVHAITDSVYVHPALSEWVQRGFYAVRGH